MFCWPYVTGGMECVIFDHFEPYMPLKVTKSKYYKKKKKETRTYDYWLFCWVHITDSLMTSNTCHFGPFLDPFILVMGGKIKIFVRKLNLHLSTHYHDYWIICWEVIAGGTNFLHLYDFGPFLNFVPL